MRLIVDARSMRLREIVRNDDFDIDFHDTFVDLDQKKIRDLNKSNSFMINIDGDIPPGMEADDMPCFKTYNWCYNIDKQEFVKVI